MNAKFLYKDGVRPVWFSRALALSLLVVSAAGLRAAEDSEARSPKLDPKRIINASQHFLHEREPDLTAEENAIYEQAMKLLATQPDYAMKLLEGLGATAEGGGQASPAFELLLGNVQYAAGDLGKAEARYQSAVRRYPSFLRAWTNLGVLYYAQGRYEQAAGCLAKAVTLGDREASSFGMLGYSLERSGNAVASELAYVQALAGDPQNIDWMEGLLRVYLAGKQYARAEVMLLNLQKERPLEAGYRRSLVRILVATQRPLEAIAVLERLRSAGLATQGDQVELADLYADQHLVPEALEAYARVPATVAVLGEERVLTLVSLQASVGRWEEASMLLQTLEPGISPAGRRSLLLAKAEVAAARRQWAAALGALEQVLQVDPLDGQALLRLGNVVAASGDEVRALIAYESALQVKESMREASLALANIELKHHHYRKSAVFLEKALALKSDKELEEVLERIMSLAPHADNPEA